MSDNLPVPRLTDLLPSIIRTVVPYLVGWIVAALASVSIVLPDDSVQSLNGLVTFIVGSLYYVLVRWLEQRYPSLGWLIGSPKQPTYSNAATIQGEVVSNKALADLEPDDEDDETVTDLQTPTDADRVQED